MVCLPHMKPTILHGENTTASREKLNLILSQVVKKDAEVVRLDEPKRDELVLASRSQSLFSEKRCVIVENYISWNKDAAEVITKDLDTEGAFFVFWEKRALTPATIKKLAKTANIQEFKLPSQLFPILDNVYPKNKKLVSLYIESKNNLEAELVFAMLTRTIRLLLWAKLSPDTWNIPSWQAGKLKAQARKFSEPELRVLHTKLLEIDRASKTSKLPEDLSSSLELLFATI